MRATRQSQRCKPAHVTRRTFLQTSIALPCTAAIPTSTSASNTSPIPQGKRAPVINAAEHAWVINDPRFPIDPKLSNCPQANPKYSQSMEYLLRQMEIHRVGKVVISHVCYYGTDNSYPIHCVKSHPDRFAAIALLVGHRLHRPDDKENPSRLERLMKENKLSGLRLSPIYDRDVVWLNDPVSYPLWKKAEELVAAFNVFLAPHQIGQIADMARRFPGVKVVIDHFAMMDITRPDCEGIDQILALEPLQNVFIRTSLHNLSKEQIPYRDVWPYLKRVYETFGPRRMLYGNFYELLIMKDLIPFFSKEDKEWILGRTAAGIYRFEGSD